MLRSDQKEKSIKLKTLGVKFLSEVLYLSCRRRKEMLSVSLPWDTLFATILLWKLFCGENDDDHIVFVTCIPSPLGTLHSYFLSAKLHQ